MKKILFTIIALMLVLGMISCGKDESKDQSTPTPAATESTEDKVSITGLDSDFSFTFNDVKNGPVVEKEATTVDSKGESSTATVKGVPLNYFLEQNGKSQKDFTSVTVVSKDSYSIAVPSDILKAKDILIIYEKDGKELSMLRTIIPDERAMYGVKDIVKIELVAGETDQAVTKAVFFETAIKDLQKYDFKVASDQEKSVKGIDLFAKVGLSASIEYMTIVSEDGLKKSEKYSVISGAYLVYTGEKAILLTSEELPLGMQVKNILSLSGDGLMCISIKAAAAKSGTDDAVTFDKLAGLTAIEKDNYTCESLSGEKLEIALSDASKYTVKIINDAVQLFEGDTLKLNDVQSIY